MGDADLRAAVRRGLILWAVPGLGRVELDGRLLRYDPFMPRVARGKQVLAILRALPAGQKNNART